MHHETLDGRRARTPVRAIRLGLAALLVFPSPCTIAAETLPAVDATVGEQLEGALESSSGAFEVLGCSAAVLLPDGGLWTGTSGISHDSTPVTSCMLFALGSVTKNSRCPPYSPARGRRDDVA